MNKNIWFCGVSEVNGVELISLIPRCYPVTPQTKPERLFYLRVNVPRDKNNGHKGAYWGPVWAVEKIGITPTISY